ncbi:MAG: terminase [Bacteroidales bacterium]|nr:terminase [Bacteroidales bacterium]
MATKKELEQKRELARLYYMQGETQKSIAAKVGVSETTVSKWADKEGWEARRAGANITRPEIVNKTLAYINKLLDKYNSEDVDIKEVGRVIDQIAKLSAVIERIDKKANVIDAIEVFTALNRWLEERMAWDSNITPELLRTINYYQDLFISEKAKGK